MEQLSSKVPYGRLMLPTATAVQIPSRNYADVFDLQVEGDEKTHGVGAGADYIGGYSGIGWYQYFIDRNTGEKYKVHCSDGVNGGKDAYTYKDTKWRHDCYSAIIERTHAETKTGQTVVYISRNEWVIMRGFMHRVWLESEEGKHDGEQSNENALLGGFVGMCRGIPVVCDLNRGDMLPPRE